MTISISGEERQEGEQVQALTKLLMFRHLSMATDQPCEQPAELCLNQMGKETHRIAGILLAFY